KTDGPHPMDTHVGSRVRLRRHVLGLSREKLGRRSASPSSRSGSTNEGNRIGASRLMALSQVLGVPVSFFYDKTDPVHAPPVASGSVEALQEGPGPDPLCRREIQELDTAYYEIDDLVVRRRLFDLAKALAGAAMVMAEPCRKHVWEE